MMIYWFIGWFIGVAIIGGLSLISYLTSDKD